MIFDKEMQKALEADGEYLRQMTGEDHGPYFIDDDSEDCWNCGGEGFVSECIDGCCEDAESGCDLCTRRCDICNPAPAPSSTTGEAA
ncbi:fructose/tagatose bisphosphate aldolase [Pseudorhizobium tarimense]|uniref:Fructose/tagatose bisphosphate aldolase n=1 Tax=Pseudorhizobium tarimense TaxID=1079109 RepID=A0ABV2H5E5_9HYPH|nr:hypothetical protein [Pseudorhizobium tarimense]MCJ8518976.1 hypothetical protein [Pseudorhizobium tarimense]